MSLMLIMLGILDITFKYISVGDDIPTWVMFHLDIYQPPYFESEELSQEMNSRPRVVCLAVQPLTAEMSEACAVS